MREFALKIVQDRRSNPSTDGNDLLTMLMKKSGGDDESEGPSDDILCDYVLNFIIAGKFPFNTFCFYR